MVKKVKWESFADHVWLFILALDIYSNNIATISLIHSRFPLILWKDDNIIISLNEERKACPLNKDCSVGHIRVVKRYMRSGITAPGSGITTLGIGISSVFVESGIKIVNVFGIRDQNSQCFCDQGLKFSTFLWSGIKIWGKNTGSVMKKNTLLRPWHISTNVV